jgi:hypothetical protein
MARDEDYTLAKHFKMLAKQLRTKAALEKSPGDKSEWQRLADCSADLADQQSPVDCFQR